MGSSDDSLKTLTHERISALATEIIDFTPPADTADADEAVIAPSMGRQMVEKVKDVFGAGTPPE